jgi:hypothetical protein
MSEGVETLVLLFTVTYVWGSRNLSFIANNSVIIIKTKVSTTSDIGDRKQ